MGQSEALLRTGGLSHMSKFHVVYFGSNDVPVDLIKPILAEIDADLEALKKKLRQ